MKYLGIDFGKKRVGIAMSDENGRFAIPESVIPNSKNLQSEICRICAEQKIGEIIIGESKDYKGNDNKIMKDILEFKKNLEWATGVKVSFEPEYMTSIQAERLQGKNEMHDASSAALILQSYLDKLNSNDKL